jgi:hypothetical protein
MTSYVSFVHGYLSYHCERLVLSMTEGKEAWQSLAMLRLGGITTLPITSGTRMVYFKSPTKSKRNRILSSLFTSPVQKVKPENEVEHY